MEELTKPRLSSKKKKKAVTIYAGGPEKGERNPDGEHAKGRRESKVDDVIPSVRHGG